MSFQVCKRDKSNNIFWLGWTVRIPKSSHLYPLKWYPSRVASDRLYDRPNQQTEDNVIDNEENRCGSIVPRVYIRYQKFDYAEVDKEHDDGNYDKEEGGIFFPEFLHAPLVYLLFQIDKKRIFSSKSFFTTLLLTFCN